MVLILNINKFRERTEIVRKGFLKKLTLVIRFQGIGGIIVFAFLYLSFLLKERIKIVCFTSVNNFNLVRLSKHIFFFVS